MKNLVLKENARQKQHAKDVLNQLYNFKKDNRYYAVVFGFIKKIVKKFLIMYCHFFNALIFINKTAPLPMSGIGCGVSRKVIYECNSCVMRY